MERENFELYPYQSHYLNIQALYLPQEKRNLNTLALIGLKRLLKMPKIPRIR